MVEMTRAQLLTSQLEVLGLGIETANRMIKMANRMMDTHTTQAALIQGHVTTAQGLIKEEMERRRG